MSNVAVEKVKEGEAPPLTLSERMIELGQKVRQRAYELFESRGCGDGRSIDDWLQAERDLVQIPESELVEKDGRFRIRIAVPGFDKEEIRVTVMPTALFVRAEAKHEREKKDGDVYFSEFGKKQIFRRLDLPAPVLVDKVTATLDHDILELTAPKTVDAANKVRAISAAVVAATQWRPHPSAA